VPYDHGFATMAKGDTACSSKHRVISLLVGYRFAHR
jgi:hypothetical protein